MASKKMKMIQMRPEPPQLADVRSDLAEAPNDDVAFTFFKSNVEGGKQPEASTQDSKTNKDLLKSSVTDPSPSSSSSAQHTKETAPSELSRCYERTLEFIKMNDYLRDSQEGLADQCAELQAMGQSIKDQVEQLRTQLS